MSLVFAKIVGKVRLIDGSYRVKIYLTITITTAAAGGGGGATTTTTTTTTIIIT